MGKYVNYTIPFVAGLVMMILEVLGFRLLAPSFGYSIYVFGSLIGVVLIALAIGYALGGYLADRNTKPRTMGILLLAAALYLTAGLWTSSSLLVALSESNLIAGTIGASVILLLPPLVILAILSPYVVRVRAVNQGFPVGVSTGNVAAWGTLGSIIGTLATSFYLIPHWGTHSTFIIAIALTTSISLPLLTPRRLWAFALIPIIMAGMRGEAARDSRVVHARESLYSALEVVDYGPFIGLRTERRSGTIQTFYPKPGKRQSFLLYDLFSLTPLFSGGTRSLLLGVGGGTIPRIHEEYEQTVQTVGVEIDPDVIELGREYFHLDELKDLTIHIADARPFVAKNRDTFDMVEIDLFGGSAEIPFYTTTKEFFTAVSNRLAAGGVATINVFDPSPQKILVGPMSNTIASVFPFVYQIEANLGSHIIFASYTPISFADRPGISQPLRDLLTHARTHNKQVTFNANELLLTDDHAPIEKLTYEAQEGVQ